LHSSRRIPELIAKPRHHFQRFNLDQAEDFVQATLEAHNLSEKEYPRIVAGQCGTWAQIAIALNKMELACEKSTEALRIRQEIYAETNVVFSQLVASYATLGRVKAMTGKLEEARALINESIRLRKEMPKFSQLQLCTPLVYLSFVEFMEGKMELARARLIEALEHREEEYGKDDTKSTR
jgi:tetratricopeptide (TPR) repeat protein